MNKLVTASEMKDFEGRVIQEIGISEAILMERAGIAVAQKAAKMLGCRHCAKILVLCGRGNNGGDGFVAARELLNQGFEVEVLLFGREAHLKSNARTNFEIFQKLGRQVHFILDLQDLAKLERLLKVSDLIIDGLLGFGLDRPVTGLLKEVILKVNQSGISVLAIDLPSGIHADTGVPLGAAINAHVTLTFGLIKRGLYSDPAADYTGEVEIAPIGFPAQWIQEFQTRVRLTEKNSLKGLMPVRVQNSHKGTYGKLAILAGSQGMVGAAVLTTQGAIRGGAGWVQTFLPKELASFFHSAVPEALTYGYSNHSSQDELIKAASSMDGLVIGPGLGQEETIRLLVEGFFHQDQPMVIDGDGLNLLAKRPITFKDDDKVVLTPHPAEAGRLLGISAKEVQGDRFRYGVELAQKYHATVLLKGRYTLISTPEGEQWVNPTGNPGMATAGSGDVLTGLIGALLVQGLKGLEAARLGAYLHGLAGDLAIERYGKISLKAGDLVEFLPKAIQKLVGEGQ